MLQYIGCSGWAYSEWEGLFYPKDLPPKERFSYYTRFFNTVELNTTFYHFPTVETVKRWAVQAPPGFKYSLKANRALTHVKKFQNIQELLKQTYGLSDILSEKTGCFLFQFPARFYFTPQRLEYVNSEKYYFLHGE